MFCVHVFIYILQLFSDTLFASIDRNEMLKKRTNSLSLERRVILSLDPYFLKFHYKFKVKAKNFLLETFPLDKYKDI